MIAPANNLLSIERVPGFQEMLSLGAFNRNHSRGVQFVLFLGLILGCMFDRSRYSWTKVANVIAVNNPPPIGKQRTTMNEMLLRVSIEMSLAAEVDSQCRLPKGDAGWQ